MNVNVAIWLPFMASLNRNLAKSLKSLKKKKMSALAGYHIAIRVQQRKEGGHRGRKKG